MVRAATNAAPQGGLANAGDHDSGVGDDASVMGAAPASAAPAETPRCGTSRFQPCPCCGELPRTDGGYNELATQFVECTKCSLNAIGATAYDDWNRRPYGFVIRAAPSETPRTDEAWRGEPLEWGTPEHTRYCTSRDLERNLAEAKRENARLLDAVCVGNIGCELKARCQSYEASEQSAPCPPGRCVMAEEDDAKSEPAVAAPPETPRMQAAWEEMAKSAAYPGDAQPVMDEGCQLERNLALALDHIEKDDKEIERLNALVESNQSATAPTSGEISTAHVYRDAGGDMRIAIRYADATEEDRPATSFEVAVSAKISEIAASLQASHLPQNEKHG